MSSGNNVREDVIRGLQTFKETFGYAPSVYICHSHNAEHPYWGEQQYRSTIAKLATWFLYRFKREEFFGHDPSSEYYWSDICRKTIRYMRLYRTRHPNVLKKNPHLPYHQFDKPDVLFWFSGTGEDYELLERITPRVLDKLAREDGAIIHYAHTSLFLDTAKSTRSGLRPEVEKAFDLIGDREDCWCSGVTAVLDRCLATKNMLVHETKHAIVFSNPTSVDVPDFQIMANYPALFSSSGEVLHPDSESRFRLGLIEGGKNLTLYLSAEAAEIGDPVGVPRIEEVRMMWEEAKRQLWKKKPVKKIRRFLRSFTPK